MARQDHGANASSWRRWLPRRRSNLTAAERLRADRQRQLNRQLRFWTPARLLGWALVAIGVLVGLVHWLAHLGWRPIPLTMGWQDLVLGYPMAGAIIVAAAVFLGRKSRHT